MPEQPNAQKPIDPLEELHEKSRATEKLLKRLLREINELLDKPTRAKKKDVNPPDGKISPVVGHARLPA